MPPRSPSRFRGSSSGGCTGITQAGPPPISSCTRFTPVFCVLEPGYPERVFGGGGTFEYSREVPDQCNIIADYPGGPSVVMTNSLSNAYPSDTDHPRHRRHHHLGNAPGRPRVRRPDSALRSREKGDRHTVERPGRHEQALGRLPPLRPDPEQPLCNIAMAVRVQAPLSMGIISHRESKVVKFDAEKKCLMTV